jgi:hypothetical protein
LDASVDPARHGPWLRHRSHANSRTFARDHAGTPKGHFGARLTMPVAAPLHEDSTGDTHGAEKPVPRADGTPALSHRMKHDKSILALAVSPQYIFAGTQGGEILV